jgi:hypothetical protein
MAFWRRVGSWFGGKGKPPDAGAQLASPDEAEPAPTPKPAAPESPAASRPTILGKSFDHVGGGIAGAQPTADVWIQGVPCRGGAQVSFHRNGRLQFAVLARAHDVAGEALPAGASIMFESDGRLRGWQQQIAADREVRVRAGDSEEVALPVMIPVGSQVSVEWGKLREVTLAAPVAFDGLAFPAGTELIFGDSGALSHVTCREELELRGIRWQAHETVVFEFGKLREGYPAEDGTYDGVPYQVGEIVRLHDNGRLARCYLAEDTRLSGVPCKEGERIYVDDRGQLLEATLSEATVLAGVPVAADSEVCLEDGMPILVTAREDCELDGIACAQGKLVELTVAGKLVRATLARVHTIDGWDLPAGSTIVRVGGRLRQLVVADTTAPDGRALRGLWRIHFDDAGAIRHLLPVSGDWLTGTITLRDRATVDGLLAGAGTNVELEPDGHVRSVVLATDQRVGEWTARAGTRVHFHASGAPSNLYLAADERISGIPCAAARSQVAVMNGVETSYREEVRLHADGSLSFAKLAAAATVHGVPLRAGETISLYETATLQVGTLAGPWTHPLGCVARNGSLLGLFEDGSPSLITLDAPFTRDNTEHPAGTVLRFTSPGVLASVDSVRVPLGPCEPVT